MIDIKKRNFLKKFFTYTCVISISTIINDSIVKNTNMKFINEDFFAMGTNGKIQAFTNNIEKGNSITQEAIKRIKNIEKLITKFSPYSDIGIINKNYNNYNYVSPETLEILEISTKYHTMTDGYFDIGLGNILTLANIDKCIPINGAYLKKNDLKEEIIKIKNDKIKINRKNSTIDLGGIGKGYALDEAIKIFKNNNIENVAIEFGGDIRVNGGMPLNLPWTITIDNKILNKSESMDNNFKIYSGGIAVSGSYLKKSPNNNIYKHHIINPKELKCNNIYSFTMVKGEDSVTCDALATAAFNMNEKELKKIKNIFKNYEIKAYKKA